MVRPNPLTTAGLMNTIEQVLEQERMSAAAPGSAMAQQLAAYSLQQSQNHNALLQQLAQNPPPTTNGPSLFVPLGSHRDLLREEERAHFRAADAALPDSDE